MFKNLYGEKRASRTQQDLDTILRAHERYATLRGGTRAILTHAELDGLVLAGRNLLDADFSGASLVGADLHGANLERASLYCADLRACDLQAARLTRADLRGASFKGAKLSHAVMDYADLRAAMMMYVNADGISVVDRERHCHGASACVPTGVDFSNCSMKGVSFGNAKLDGANFSGALLQGANFRSARLTNATFRNAVLTGVNLSDLSVPAASLQGCVLDVTPAAAAKFDQLKSKLDAHQEWIVSGGRNGAPANLDGEDLRPLQKLLVGRSFAGLSARKAIAVGLDFSGSHLQAAKLDGADLRDTDFSNADLRGASLRGAKLAHARFEGANLTRLALTNGTALAPDLSEADAEEEQFYSAILDVKMVALGLPAALARLNAQAV